MLLPYLELPVWVGYGQDEGKIVKLKIQPTTITAYHEGFNDAGIFIYCSDQPFQIALTIEQYEAQIRAYWDLIQKEDANRRDLKQKLKIIN